jgi:SEC-C motif domain protein
VSCVCGKGESLEACCGRYISGKEAPKTAEELMRSRYAAYATENVDYVLATHLPSRREEVDRASTEAWSKAATWLGLEIVRTSGGGEGDERGEVEFVAKYKIKQSIVQHHELATFVKEGGKWYFEDGKEVSTPPIVNDGPKLGRNDVCHCGSGKKYKKCHGKAA